MSNIAMLILLLFLGAAIAIGTVLAFLAALSGFND